MDERTFYRLIGGILKAIDECADGLEKTVILIKETNKAQSRINAMNAIVTGGIAFADLTEAVGFLSDIKHRLSKRSLAAAAMAKQANVTDILGQYFFHCSGYSFICI